MHTADLIIIGAGPAGLAAAQYGTRANLSVTVLEHLAPGGQVLLIDTLENYPGLVPAKSGFDFCEDMRKQAESFGAKFISEAALSVTKNGNIFTVSPGNGQTLTAPSLIAATGTKHNTLDIAGEKEYSGRGVSYCATCDGPFFKNKKVFVVGGGDSACDEAQYLSRLAGQVILIHRREKFRAQKALAARVLNNPKIEVRFNTVMREIKGAAGSHGGGKVTSVILAAAGQNQADKSYEETADGVFIFAGTLPQTSLFAAAPDSLKPKLDETGYIITNQNMASSVPGLFAAGDVRATPFRQIVTAAADGAIAAHYAAAYIDELKGDSYS